MKKIHKNMDGSTKKINCLRVAAFRKSLSVTHLNGMIFYIKGVPKMYVYLVSKHNDRSQMILIYKCDISGTSVAQSMIWAFNNVYSMPWYIISS